MAISDRDKRTLKIGGIVVGVLAVIFVALKLLGGGGGEEAATSFSPRSTTSAPGGTGGGAGERVPEPRALAGPGPAGA